MTNRCLFLCVALLAAACAGCCGERVWRCPDGQCSSLSGRFDDCSGCMPGMSGNFRNRITCGKGCGEIYWDEWWSDPPAPCDPCDECSGCFVGRRCCPPSWFRNREAMLFGGRYCEDPCAGGSCPCQGQAEYGDVIEDVPAAVPTQAAAPQPEPELAPQQARRASAKTAQLRGVRYGS